jgi:cell division FtsZ-interacting protein ZapD
MKKPMPASLWWTVLIAVLLTITLSSCSRSKSTPEDIRVDAFNALRTEIVSIVAADDRQQQALNNVDEFERLFSNSGKVLESQRAKLRDLTRNYDATREQFDSLIAETAALLKEEQVKVLDVRARMAAVLTDDEWLALEKSRNKAIKKAFGSLNPV